MPEGSEPTDGELLAMLQEGMFIANPSFREWVDMLKPEVYAEKGDEPFLFRRFEMYKMAAEKLPISKVENASESQTAKLLTPLARKLADALNQVMEMEREFLKLLEIAN